MLAKALLNAAAIIEDGRLSAFVRARYANWDSAFGKQAAAVLSLQDIAEHALGSKHQVLPASGRQEYLENLINRFV